MLCYIRYVMLRYITYVMLYNICLFMLYDIFSEQNMLYNMSCLSNRPHFLWIYLRDNPRGMLGEHEKSL